MRVLVVSPILSRDLEVERSSGDVNSCEKWRVICVIGECVYQGVCCVCVYVCVRGATSERFVR